MSLGIGSPEANERSTGGPSRTCCPGAQTKSSVPPWRPPEAQDAVGAPSWGPWSDAGVGWARPLWVLGEWSSARGLGTRACCLLTAGSRCRPAGTATCSTWSTCSSTAPTWRPRTPRGTRPCISAPSTTRSVRHAGGRAPPTPCLAARAGAGAGTVPRALQGAVWVSTGPSRSPADGPGGWRSRSGCRQVLLPGKALSRLRVAPSVRVLACRGEANSTCGLF